MAHCETVGYIFTVVAMVIIFLPTSSLVSSDVEKKRKNVLFLISDDLRPELGVYHQYGLQDMVNPKMYTPNLDDLASKSLLFTKAFVQYGVCAPSRSSCLTGRRPDTTRVYNLHDYWREVGGNFTTIPQYFKEHGYLTKGIGKIFHPKRSSGMDDDAISWTETYFHPSSWYQMEASWGAVPAYLREKDPLPDEQIAEEAIQTLRDMALNVKKNQANFFLAAGFIRPHLPWLFPEEFLRYYPIEDIQLPKNPHIPRNMPVIAWSHFHELIKYNDNQGYGITGEMFESLPAHQEKNLRRAYFASVSFVDSMVGKVVKELEDLGLADDTIVVFWGDHGFLLGEHAGWTKHSLFELVSHVPLMIRDPGVTDAGMVSHELVELVDLFPTLAEAAGLPTIPTCLDHSSQVLVCTEGSSVVPLMTNPAGTAWKDRVFTQQMRFLDEGGEELVMGYSMRTHQYRYSEWVMFEDGGPQWSDLQGVELYDLVNDPLENINVAFENQYENIRRVLSEQLRQGWRHALPRTQ